MKTLVLAPLLAALCLLPRQAPAENHRIGVGATYWVSLDDLDEEGWDESGLGYLVTYQYRPTLLGIEAALELLPDHLGEDTLAPQAYLVLGRTLYAAAGIGVLYSDSDFADKPFYAFKAGLDLEILPSLYLDLSANYRFSRREDLDDPANDIGFDTVYLGAAVRLKL